MRPDPAVRTIPGLAHLPDEARLWIFGASRPISEQEVAPLVSITERFLEGWAAHGQALAAALDEDHTAPSGCSIDALTRHVMHLETELDVRLLDGGAVWFRDAAGVRQVDRREFRQMAARGEVDGDTIVFDLAVQRLGDVRTGGWELPAASSWHARLLPSAG